MIAAVPPEIIAGGVALVVILTLAWWGWTAQKKVGAIKAWLEQAKREQEGRKRFDAELEAKSGGLGKRIRDRNDARRLRERPKR